MPRWTLFIERRPPSRLRRFLAALWTILVVSGGVLLLVFALPFIGALVLALVGLGLLVVLAGGIAALIFGWRLRRELRRHRPEGRQAPRQSKRVNVRLHHTPPRE